MSFHLNERLAAGGFDFGTLGICRVLLKDNAVFPWFLLVPEVDAHITELHQLDSNDYTSVSFTIRQISNFVDSHFNPDKLNVAAIGNIVPQLHIHIVARSSSDPAWPGVVWGCPQKRNYNKEETLAIHEAYLQSLT
ncbi:MAG: HIT family protein [Verrucomicrobiae bacterium]|nr:HIT family protein [Verrucomicrobiae bacterium]NNJ42433.1 HIT family protein [Akkermansiaceae bacterium]